MQLYIIAGLLALTGHAVRHDLVCLGMTRLASAMMRMLSCIRQDKHY